MLLITTIGTSILMLAYLWDLRKVKFTTQNIVTVGMFSAMSFVLYLIQFVKYPQGGGISLFSMLPTLILGILYGHRIGITGGLIFGLLKCLNGAVIIHPAQFILDYLLANMALGLVGIGYGGSSRFNLLVKALASAIIGVSCLVISGAVFFGEYAPAGMNIWWYAFLYNISSAGVESILSVLILMLMPIARLKRILRVPVIK